jgi:endonuclease YncB( thermonuclease family)
MGWRTDEAYEKAEREREREWIASLPRAERLRLRLYQVCGIGIFICIILLAAAFVFRAHATPIEVSSIEVVDGDTIRVGATTVRLVGFNTPEPGSQAKCEAERTLAAKASWRLRQLVAAGGLTLEQVPCACPPGTEGTQRCNYGRLCGVLKAAGRDVGTVLISEGLAREYLCGRTNCPRRASWCAGS